MITTEDTGGHGETQGKTAYDYEVSPASGGRESSASAQNALARQQARRTSKTCCASGSQPALRRRHEKADLLHGFTSQIYFTTSSVFSAPFFTPWPTALVPFFTPCPVSLATVLVASPVLSAAFSVASPVFTAAFLVACPVFFAADSVVSSVLSAAFSVACPVFTAAFLVACPVSLAASFTSVPTWPYENAVSASSAAAITIIKENFVFIIPPKELRGSWKVLSEMMHGRNSVKCARVMFSFHRELGRVTFFVVETRLAASCWRQRRGKPPLYKRVALTQCDASEVSFSSSLRVSSSMSHFFRIVKMVFAPNPARIKLRKMRAVCF